RLLTETRGAHVSVSPLQLCAIARLVRDESTLTESAFVTPLESALTKKRGGGLRAATVHYSSSPAERSLARSVFGVMPSSSAARVLFHLHSRSVVSSRARSTWLTARPVTSSSEPDQLKFSGSMPAGTAPSSGLAEGSCKPSARMAVPSARITARSSVF